MNSSRRSVSLSTATATAAAAALTVMLVLVIGLTSASEAASPSLGQLNSELGQQQDRQRSLSASIGSLNQVIATLDGQIALIQGREAAVRDELANDRAALSRVALALVRQQHLLAVLRARLALSREILSRQLVAGYENDKPDLVSVVLEARGFNDLLEQLDFLRRAERQQQSIITITRNAKARADAAAHRLAALQASDRRITAQTYLHAQALAGMNELLQGRESALREARAAQQAALQASVERGGQLKSQIGQVRAEIAARQAAAARRAAAAAAAAQRAATASPTPVAVGLPSLGPTGGWAIPYAIVLCESGGQNLTPNSAGASGYYQIIPATWRLFGGSGPAAYLAGRAEQDAVASRIWNGGAGASNWVCAGIVGIH
jgi:septal ring factor EnvC (AmiA/AmiB activator)